MTSRSLALSLALLVTGTLVSFETGAQSPNEDPARAKEDARLHFERGVTHAGEGRLEAAVQEFESAYRIRPHYSVLFNLGQARAAMGRSVEAVDAFRRYLEEGGSTINSNRRAHVELLIAFHEKRIGSVRLTIEPEGAEVWLDGRLLGQSPVSETLRLVEGSHGIAVRKSGFAPTERTVEITAGSTIDVALRAEAAAAGAAPLGVVLVRCPVPDVRVSIDGNDAGVTSSDKLFRAPTGRTSLRLARSGYVTDTHTVEVSPDRPAEITCRLEQDGKGPRGALNVRARPAHAAVSVDGKRYRGEALPVGSHAVRVEQPGYRPFTALVRVDAAKTAQVAADLEQTKEQRDAWQAERSSKTTWAIATTIGGLVLAGAGVATYVWNGHRYDDWADDRRALDAKLNQGPATPALLDQNEALNRRSLSIERVDILAVGLGIAGAVTLGISGAMWIGVVGEEGER